jgi:DNA-binding transcriptional LysR family regulator
VLKALHDGRDAIHSLQELQLGMLRLGAAPTITTYVLPGLLKEFCLRYPQIEVSVQTEHSEQIAQMVLADEVQVGLERSISHPDVVTVPLYDDEVVLVASAKHPFAQTGAATLEEISTQPLIMFSRGSGYYTLVDTALSQAGILVSPTMELDNMEATKKMVEEGLGIAVLPRVAVEREVDAGELRHIDVSGLVMPKRQIAMIYRRARPLSRAAQAFVTLVEERYGVKAEASLGTSASRPSS